ncbi:glycosyltransferase family 2 protein [Arthrobacter flavus]|uniref:Glycosyltransferase family 2 protein n=1 Tax=Arthrobacter flavus TaxID=95172 RepID=A0ABW4QAR9_9MICC
MDVLISGTATFADNQRGPRTILKIDESPRADGWSTALPPINTRFVSPQGFEPYPAKGRLEVRLGESGALDFVDGGGELLASIGAGTALDEFTLELMRDRSYLDFSRIPMDIDLIQMSRLVSAGAVGGVPMLISSQHREGLLLGQDLVETLSTFSEEDTAMVRESKSILMRRTALKYFAPSQRWAYWVKRSGLAPATESVSVILATKRAGRVAEAVRQVSEQTWPEVEIVLVLHGFDMTGADLSNLVSAAERPVTVVRADGNLMLGEVLNLGVEAASGSYIAKMDDDDWYGSHHLEDLMQARVYSGADLLGSQVEFVYLEELDITTRRPPEGERYSDHVAGGTMLIGRSTLREVGGWRPVHRAVDRCLLNAVEAVGGLTYRGHGQNYMMHRHAQEGNHGGHTWAPDTEIFVQNSVQQWDGFVLPPQIESSWTGEAPVRSMHRKSIFSNSDACE